MVPSYVRVSILGSSQGGEVWSVNPVFDPTGEFGPPNQAGLDAVAIAIRDITLPAALLTCMSSSLAITGARVEVRDSAGDALQAVSTAIKSSPVSGTGTAFMPAQAAFVTSLRTDTPGPSGRGRLYWPCVGMSISSSLRINNPSTTTLNTAMKTYLTAIRAALVAGVPGAVYDLAVRSRKTGTSPHVTRLQIGDVVDTQRRRRDRMPEAYNTVTFP